MLSGFLETIKNGACNVIRGDKVCEVRVVMLGARGAGKSSMLTAMYERFRQSKMSSDYDKHISINGDEATNNVMKSQYDALCKMANSDGDITNAIKPSTGERTYKYTISDDTKSGEDSRIVVSFTDYPGGWLTDNHRSHVKEMIKEAHVLLVAIDAPYLMEEGGDYNNKRNMSEEFTKLIEEAWRDSTDVRRMVLLVPIKCERYCKSNEEKKCLVRRVKKAYSEFIEELKDNQNYCGVFIVPIETTGTIHFKQFSEKPADGIPLKQFSEKPAEYIPLSVFESTRKPGHDGYAPRNCSQPLRFVFSYALSALIQQDQKGVRGALINVFNINRHFKNALQNIAGGCSGEVLNPMCKRGN
ncbi:MAG: hypothetical protein Q4D58_07240 [Synergistaceae bacterium]|nr:hypothetical protein [Synergistaceae bacterium]